jgi:aspartyl-tRNA(Asn)/glutamyl-tRNA(Gln) amidotransferase subunit A
VRKLLHNQVKDLFEKYDAIILPTSPTTAFSIGQKDKDPLAMYLADIFTVFANLAGLPAISIPLYRHSNRMPFGLQVLVKQQRELTLLAVSSLLMQQKAHIQHEEIL